MQIHSILKKLNFKKLFHSDMDSEEALAAAVVVYILEKKKKRKKRKKRSTWVKHWFMR